MIYGHFAAIWKPDSGRNVYKTYIFNNYNLLSSKPFVILLVWAKTLLLPKNADFLKNVDISKTKSTLVLKGIFS